MINISNEHLIEKTRSKEDIYDGKIIDVKKLAVELPNGNEAYREVVYHKGAVAVIATGSECMYFVKQFRISTEEVLLEVPAGKIEIDEHPDDTVKKELKEEIGGESGDIKKLYEFYVSPGFSNELIHLYEAKEVSFGDSQLEDDEFLDIVKIPLTELKEKMHNGQVRDGKTLVAVHHVLLSRGYL